jgi:hypothetical protein
MRTRETADGSDVLQDSAESFLCQMREIEDTTAWDEFKMKYDTARGALINISWNTWLCSNRQNFVRCDTDHFLPLW